MSLRGVVFAAVLAHVIGGNLWVTPFAEAASHTLPSDDTALEMVMSPLEPLSAIRCQYCAEIPKPRPIPLNANCTGPALLQGSNAIDALLPAGRAVPDRTALPLEMMTGSSAHERSISSYRQRPCPAPSSTETVVLRE